MIKKFVAGLALVGMLSLPVGCMKSEFVSNTDKIGRALATINAVYFVVEARLEKALEQELPDADVLQGYLTVLKNLRDHLATLMPEDAEQADAAVAASVKLLDQSKEVVE